MALSGACGANSESPPAGPVAQEDPSGPLTLVEIAEVPAGVQPLMGREEGGDPPGYPCDEIAYGVEIFGPTLIAPDVQIIGDDMQLCLARVPFGSATASVVSADGETVATEEFQLETEIAGFFDVQLDLSPLRREKPGNYIVEVALDGSSIQLTDSFELVRYAELRQTASTASGDTVQTTFEIRDDEPNSVSDIYIFTSGSGIEYYDFEFRGLGSRQVVLDDVGFATFDLNLTLEGGECVLVLPASFVATHLDRAVDRSDAWYLPVRAPWRGPDVEVCR